MKVKDLIKELKKMPQNLEVGFSSHDNEAHELQGWACYCDHIIKDQHIDKPMLAEDLACLKDMPDEWVSIRC